MEILVVEGTVRRGRRSIYAARYAADVLRERGHDVTLFDMAERDVPLLETRRYKDPGDPPQDVEEYGQLVEAADGIVLVAPEYNHSYPGALKNLVDYLYPEYEDTPFAFVTVSGGGFGGVRCQSDLEQLVVTLQGHPGPSLPVSRVQEVFDDDGELVDDAYRDRFSDWADRVEQHTERFS